MVKVFTVLFLSLTPNTDHNHTQLRMYARAVEEGLREVMDAAGIGSFNPNARLPTFKRVAAGKVGVAAVAIKKTRLKRVKALVFAKAHGDSWLG